MFLNQVIDERRIYGWFKRIEILKPSTDKFITGSTNKRLHLRKLGSVTGSFDVDQPEFARFGGRVELMLGW